MDPQARVLPSPPSISVVIRTRTDSAEALGVFERLKSQRLPPAETIVVDSGSAAAVLAKLERLPIRLIRMAPSDYSSASALNLAISQARGDLIAILSQDALPRDESYLEALAAAFDSPLVAGAYGRQIPRASGDHPLNVKDLTKTYPPVSRVQTRDCWFDNACSMIRADLWRRHPFAAQAVISEDHEWAKWAQSLGLVIKYQAEAVVEHSHPRTIRGVWRRSRLEGQGLAWVHGRRVSLARALFCCAREVASDAVWLLPRGQGQHVFGSVGYRLAKHLGLCLGSRKGFSPRH
jgi:rhamnosyltransferase